jgi:acetylglutamate synthase
MYPSVIVVKNPDDRPSMEQIVHGPLIFQFRIEYLENENTEVKEKNLLLKRENEQSKSRILQVEQKLTQIKSIFGLL